MPNASSTTDSNESRCVRALWRYNGTAFKQSSVARCGDAIHVGVAMTIEIRYVKRIELELDLSQRELAEPNLPPNFFWRSWSSRVVSTHARIMHEAFCNDVDGRIFPTYRQYSACEHLIASTSSSPAFAPNATWLIGRYADQNTSTAAQSVLFCAAIQCVFDSKSIGVIQNVSVLPAFRRLGLGAALVLKALLGLRACGSRVARLEATAENANALRLYRSLGFIPTKTTFAESFVDLSPESEFFKCS